MQSKVISALAAAAVLIAGCSAASHPPSASGRTAAATVLTPSASQSATPSASPSPAESTSPDCRDQLKAWLDGSTGSALTSIPQDLTSNSKDLSAVAGDIVHGRLVRATLNKWMTDLISFKVDAIQLQSEPAPACDGGRELNVAAQNWLLAATAYQQTVEILLHSPNATGVRQSNAVVGVGNTDLKRAQKAAAQAARLSHGLIPDVAQGSGA